MINRSRSFTLRQVILIIIIFYSRKWTGGKNFLKIFFNWVVTELKVDFYRLRKIQNNSWDIAGQSQRLQQVSYGRRKLKLQKKKIISLKIYLLPFLR